MKPIDFTNHKCLECGRECANRRSLCNHLVRFHKIHIKDYVLKNFHKNIVPKCKCGCGNDVLWNQVCYSFNDYLNGHNQAGFTSREYKQTKEVHDRRIEKIRQTYSGERSEEIKQKISESVTDAFSRQETIERHRIAMEDHHKRLQENETKREEEK